ncbi:MAG: ACP S-malonyltransferase [Ruminococcus sp.]|uniref:Malonyl CoA-acyl carrier protein transacylase n=1 Tax=Schaedlerella arabinosiphila TaxID=2044587 RepID=A0A426DJS0_9FIRM|nr:ACP S-malonyltransferase [Schaedlerella arabinosiphila]MCI8723617.1 ACP S-malonyltransferase [Ruminococcus sp.]MCI9211850.1 ACP S-malonyltransferase [Ruminococcus sp.]RRK32873.1 [acyl-carrier-protein] S-malonyltransferase [Schaedlerella arabinosiphila]
MSGSTEKTAWIFPGQGAQKCGMGKDFYEQSKAAKEIFDQASELLGLDMAALCFEENDRLDQTEYTQAALVTTCLAMAGALEDCLPAPDVTAGLSLGEYCAIAAAGGMQICDAVTTVRKRGIYMQNAVPDGEGAMSAVLGLSGEQIETAIAGLEGVYIANYNCPGQIVITGYRQGVEKASEVLSQAGAKRVLPLKVSGPFHSPMMKEAGDKLEQVLQKTELTPLRIPYVTNVTAEYVRDIQETKKLLREQVASSVRWQQSMERMIADGVTTFVEIGPGKTLAGFLRKISRDVKVINIASWEDREKL